MSNPYENARRLYLDDKGQKFVFAGSAAQPQRRIRLERLLPATQTYKDRVKADGGTVQSDKDTDDDIRQMKDLGCYPDAELRWSRVMGSKTDADGIVTLYDASSNGNDLTSPGPAPALTADGVQSTTGGNEYLAHTDITDLGDWIENEDLTFSFRIRSPEQVSGASFWGIRDSNYHLRFLLNDTITGTANRLWVLLSGASQKQWHVTDESDQLFDGDWHTVTVVIRQSSSPLTAALWIDGVAQGLDHRDDGSRNFARNSDLGSAGSLGGDPSWLAFHDVGSDQGSNPCAAELTDLHLYRKQASWDDIYTWVETNGDATRPSAVGPSWSTPTQIPNNPAGDTDDGTIYYFHGFDAQQYLSSPDAPVYFYGSGNHPAAPGGIYRWTADDFTGTNLTFQSKVISSVIERKIRVPATAWDGSQMVLYLKDDGAGGSGKQTYRYTSSDGISWALDGSMHSLNTDYLVNHAGNQEIDTTNADWYAWTNIDTNNGAATAVHKSTDSGATWSQIGYSPRLIDDSGLVIRRPLGDTFNFNGERWAVCLMWPANQASGNVMSGARVVQVPISDDRRRYLGPPEVIFDPANDSTLSGNGDLQSGVVRVIGNTAHLWIQDGNSIYYSSASL